MTAVKGDRRSAAIALVAMGPDRAAAVLRTLEEHEVTMLVTEISALGSVQPDEVVSTMNRLSRELSAPSTLPAPGKRFAKDLLVKALGPDRGAALAAGLDVEQPFAWLADGDPDILAGALAKEPPGALALALAHLDPTVGSRLMTALPEDVRLRTVARLAALGAVHPDTVRQVEETMRGKVSDLVATEMRPVSGPSLLAGLLTRASRTTSKEVLGALAEADPELAELTREAMFTFDDACALPPRTLQVLLRAIDGRQLALSLHGMPEEIVSRVLDNLSERAREGVNEERELLFDARQSDVTAARAALLATARALEEEGTLTLTRDEAAA